MDNLFDIVSNDYVRTYTALAGFLISIINSIYLISINTFNINLIQKSYAFCENEYKHPAYFEFAIENNSRLQLSLSRMFLYVNDRKFEFKWEKERIGRTEFKSGDRLIEGYSTYSLTLPQSIPGLGVIGGFFYVETDKSITEREFINSKVYVEICTNRGNKKFKIDPLSLPVHL